MTILHLDFESRSAVDLKKAGLHNYAAHPSTEVLCMAYAFDDGPVKLWRPDEMFPPEVEKHVFLKCEVVAHNAAFEIAIWNGVLQPRWNLPPLKPEQVRCTMAQCYAMALPGALDNAAPAAGIKARKDAEGHRIMMQVSKPRKVNDDGSVVWWEPAEHPDKFAKLYAYCRQDTVVERELDDRVLRLSDREKHIWTLDQRINARGIQVDLPTVRKALLVIEAEKKRLDAQMRKLTGNQVDACTATGQLYEWLTYRGIKCEGVAKDDITNLLDAGDAGRIELAPDVRAVLRLRQEAGKSSTAKYESMLKRAGSDGRIRGMFQYHGAATGRWSGRGVQVHNLPRPTIEQGDIERAIRAVQDFPVQLAVEYLNLMFDSPMQALSDCIRGMLIAAPGKVLMAADYANIEGRALAWEAGEQWKLDAFRAYDAGTGPDLYKLAYSKSFGIPVEQVTKPQRQIGKVEELALGYQGGVGAFHSMGKNYGVKLSDAEADRVKVGWRDAHPATVNLWHAVERAARRAVERPGSKQAVGPVVYRMAGSFLWCRLAGGRVLCYPYPELDQDGRLSYMAEDVFIEDKSAPTGVRKVKWGRTQTYGGSLVENITQAIARDVLAEAIVRLEEQGVPVVLHVHDEAVVEVATGEYSLAALEETMAALPAWAKGLPIAVEGWEGHRYRK